MQPDRCCKLPWSVEPVEALAEFLAGLEEWRSLARHGYLLASAGVMRDPLATGT